MAGTRVAFITGAASGIGKQLAFNLAKDGWHLTLSDINKNLLEQTAGLLCGQHPQCRVLTLNYDVSDVKAQEAAFQQHAMTYGRLDFLMLNAGIGGDGNFFDSENEKWLKVLNVDLTAVLHGVRCGVRCMKATGSKGSIISLASAAGLYPMPASPVYSAAKAGVVFFTQAVGRELASSGIRVLAVCPEFVDTPLVRDLMKTDTRFSNFISSVLKDQTLLSPEYVVNIILESLNSQRKSGTIVFIRQNGSVEYPHSSPKISARPTAPSKELSRPSQPSKGLTSQSLISKDLLMSYAQRPLPMYFSKIQVVELSSDFRRATRIIKARMPHIPPKHLLVRRIFTGINASDINFSAGRYHASLKQAANELPFDAGFETVNVVVGVGEDVSGFKVGDSVAALSYGGFSEFALLPVQHALPIPTASPQALALLTSGLTASIALELHGKLAPGEVVLVTGAAGGTGQFAVQLAVMAGCHIIATCGSAAKGEMLRRLGAHRVVDYTKENLSEVLAKEYPKGVDVVYEGVGGDMFHAAVRSLASNGRLIIIGMMSQYKTGENGGWGKTVTEGLPEKLLWKSATLAGFFLLKHTKLFRPHLTKLLALVEAGRLEVVVDEKKFLGVDSVADAVDYLQSGKSTGKVMVQMAMDLPTQPSKL